MRKNKFLFIVVLVFILEIFYFINFQGVKVSANAMENKERLKSIDNIDFSKVKYFKSETSRDKRLEKEIEKAFNLEKGMDKVRYYFNRLQLNCNREEEVFVYLVQKDFCGTGGCSAAVFTILNGNYRLISKFTLVNNPIVITNNFTNGYRDIIMYTSGGGQRGAYRYLKFDGEKYPQNPSVQDKVPANSKIEGDAIIADDITKNKGIEF